MLTKEIKKKYSLVYQCLTHIAANDGTGSIDDTRELPNIYDNTTMEDFIKNFDNWLDQFNGKKLDDVICPQDFKDYLGWDNTIWDFYDSYHEWEDIYSQYNSIEAFASSESSVMAVIELKYDGRIYSDFLVDCFNGDVPVFSGFTPYS